MGIKEITHDVAIKFEKAGELGSKLYILYDTWAFHAPLLFSSSCTPGPTESGVRMCQQLGSEVERQGKANKSTTPRTALSFQGKEELPWVGFESKTLCSLGERSTN